MIAPRTTLKFLFVKSSRSVICVVMGAVLLTGCSEYRTNLEDAVALRRRANECLKQGVRYEFSATARIQAIEALQDCGGEDVIPWIRQALHDEVPAVRFAAMLALGNRQDKVSEPVFRELHESDLMSDRLAAVFALHKLGDASYTGELADSLMNRDDVAGQKHAAMILGRLGEDGAVKLLARQANASDPGLRANVLEALVLLGSKEGQAAVYATAYSGIGAEEAFALTVLGRNPLTEHRDLFYQKLKSAAHIETRLTAARALGNLGDKRGYKTALKALGFTETRGTKNDPAENRTFRVRQLAAIALGAIGDPRALDKLKKVMNTEGEPRLQIAAAKAILDILGDEPPVGSGYVDLQ